jgi:hypothetical protein
VQKTIRVIRRTVLQNGREISVEEQVEEEPPLVVETELIPPKRGSFRIPSPFGIVEEPIFQDEQHVRNNDTGTVEITDITDQYDGREATSLGPSVDQFIEIHEVLDDHQIIEQPESSQKVIEVFSPNDDVAPQSQSRTVFETLHEQEEEPEVEQDESTELESVEIQLETKINDELKANFDNEKDSEETSEVEPELKGEFQQLEKEITFQMVTEVQEQSAGILEGLMKEPDNEISSEPTIEGEVVLTG